MKKKVKLTDGGEDIDTAMEIANRIISAYGVIEGHGDVNNKYRDLLIEALQEDVIARYGCLGTAEVEASKWWEEWSDKRIQWMVHSYDVGDPFNKHWPAVNKVLDAFCA